MRLIYEPNNESIMTYTQLAGECLRIKIIAPEALLLLNRKHIIMCLLVVLNAVICARNQSRWAWNLELQGEQHVNASTASQCMNEPNCLLKHPRELEMLP